MCNVLNALKFCVLKKAVDFNLLKTYGFIYFLFEFPRWLYPAWIALGIKHLSSNLKVPIYCILRSNVHARLKVPSSEAQIWLVPLKIV